MDNNAKRHSAIRWGAAAAAAAVLIGGGAALAAGGGSPDPAAPAAASSGPAAELNAVLTAAGSPTTADLDATSPDPSTSPATGTQHPCAKAAGVLRAAGHPRAARRARAACRGGARRLALLGGIHGQVTYRGKDGKDTTLAFERGKITAVNGSAVTVQAPDGTTWTWHLVSDTVIRQGGQKASSARLAAGQRVFAGGPVVSGADDARLIVVRPAVSAGSSSP
jgi:hypothetical protein